MFFVPIYVAILHQTLLVTCDSITDKRGAASVTKIANFESSNFVRSSIPSVIVSGHHKQADCEPIKVDLCRNMGYAKTALPNFANNTLQTDAKDNLDTFIPLIQTRCSPHLHMFLCAVYVPMCFESTSSTYNNVIGPCRPLCQRMEDACSPHMEKHGFRWPKVLECSNFPESNNEFHMCMDGPPPSSSSTPMQSSDDATFSQTDVDIKIPSVLTSHDLLLTPLLVNSLKTNTLFRQKVEEKLQNSVPESDNMGVNFTSPIRNHGTLHSYLELLSSSQLLPKSDGNLCIHPLEVYVPRLNACAVPCQAHVWHAQSEKVLADAWLGITSTLAFCSAIFALTTLVVCVLPDEINVVRRNINWKSTSPNRHPSHTKPPRAVYMILSNLILSSGYFLRIVFGRTLSSCDDGAPTGQTGLLLLEGHRSSVCSLIFTMVHFGEASLTAWFLICLASVSVKRYIQLSDTLCHSLAWGFSTFYTLAMILMAKVQAGELLAVCGVGRQSPLDFVYFDVIPSLFALLALYVVIAYLILMANDDAKSLWNDFKIVSLLFCACKTMITVINFVIFTLKMAKMRSVVNWTSTSELELTSVCLKLIMSASICWILLLKYDVRKLWLTKLNSIFKRFEVKKDVGRIIGKEMQSLPPTLDLRTETTESMNEKICRVQKRSLPPLPPSQQPSEEESENLLTCSSVVAMQENRKRAMTTQHFRQKSWHEQRQSTLKPHNPHVDPQFQPPNSFSNNLNSSNIFI